MVRNSLISTLLSCTVRHLLQRISLCALSLPGRLQHDHYLILTRHAADEAEYEALLAVQATLQAETAEMTNMASETAGRLQHIRNLLNTGRFGDFSKTEIMDFYAEFTKLITKLHHSLLAVPTSSLSPK